MRILHLNTRAGAHGGVERILQDIAVGLGHAGHRQALLHSDPAPEAGFLETFTDASATAGGERLLARFRPDCALIHKFDDADAIAELAGRLPVARMVHDHDLVCLRRHKYFPLGAGICEQPAGAACYLHLCFVQRAPAHSALPLRLASVRAVRRTLAAHRDVRTFIVGSRWMRQELQMNGIDAQRIEILPPVPLSLADTGPLPPAAEPEILFVGQVIRGKGVDLLLQALAKVPPPWHATIVGTGNHLARCQQLAGTLGIAAAVDFTGWVDHGQLETHYARARLTAVPSRWPEPFGMVGIEAMARGRPVVGFAAGGIPDWLDDGVTGLLAPAADTDALAARIAQLLADPALAARLGAQGAERVRMRYRPEDFLQSLSATLARIAAAPSSPPGRARA